MRGKTQADQKKRKEEMELQLQQAEVTFAHSFFQIRNNVAVVAVLEDLQKKININCK